MKTISFRPSEKATNFIESLCSGDDAVLSQSQLIEISVRLMMSIDKEDFDQIITAIVKNKSKEFLESNQLKIVGVKKMKEKAA